MSKINEDVVISGIGGFFPKSNNIAEFKEQLFANNDLMGTRWMKGERGVTNIIGKISDSHFDNSYFGIHRSQSFYMDPTQRLALERTYEALIDAGVNPSELRGKRVGCFMGSSVGCNDLVAMGHAASGFTIVGRARAMLANRISYWLNLKGPSFAVASNWLSGNEVIRLGYEAIKNGECEAAIVGCANFVLNSDFQWIYNDMGLLSDDGKTRPFDVNANGYVRSDGVVILFLQRASEARRCYANIVHIATHFDAHNDNGITHIDSNNLTNFLDTFYKDCNFDPEDVEFVEAYGCGIKDIDKSEVDAFEEVYCKKRKTPLLIGSVKSITGHSEATSTLFSVAKVLVAMETGVIPATQNYNLPNSDILPLIRNTVQVVDDNRQWSGQYAAVNSCGLTCGFGHLLLKANTKLKIPLSDNIPRLIIASSRTMEGIQEVIKTVQNKETCDVEYVKLLNELFSKEILNHVYRGYAIVNSNSNKSYADYFVGQKRQIWFVYSGMGSQWPGMLSDFMKFPTFAQSITNCHQVLAEKNVNLLEIMTSTDAEVFDNIMHCFVSIAAMQIALTDLLKSMNIVPDMIIGHSAGELGCAYGDDSMSAKQTMLAAYSRGMASLEAVLIKGMMAAVGLGYEKIKHMLPESIEVACHNSPDSSTISGPAEDMEKFVKELQQKGVFARLVNVANIAYHSRYIKPVEANLLKKLKEVIPEPKMRSSKWISTSNLEENWNTELAKYSSAEYHTNNLVNSVLFEEGLRHVPKNAILIEIAPHGLLQAILRRCLRNCNNIPLTQKGCKSGAEFLLSALGTMYLAGIELNPAVLFPKIELPVGKGTDTLTDLVHWDHREVWRLAYEDSLHALSTNKEIVVSLNSEHFTNKKDYQIDEDIILPCSWYLNLIFEIVSTVTEITGAFIFENVQFRKTIIVTNKGDVPIYAMVQKGTLNFEIISNSDIIVTGKFKYPIELTDKILLENFVFEENLKENQILNAVEVYDELFHRGHSYNGEFKQIQEMKLNSKESVIKINWTNKWQVLIEAMIQQRIFNDGELKQNACVLNSIDYLYVDLDSLAKEAANITAIYKKHSNVMYSGSVQIVDMKTHNFIKQVKKIYCKEYKFTPLNGEAILDMEELLDLTLSLTINNFDGAISNIVVTELQTINSFGTKIVKNALDKYNEISSNLSMVDNLKSISLEEIDPTLLLYNGTLNRDLVELVKHSPVMVLLKSSLNISLYNNITQVAQFMVNAEKYSIVRPVNHNQTIPIYVTNSLNIADLTIKISKVTLNSTKFIVSNIIPNEGIVSFTNRFYATANTSLVRFVFVSDTNKELVTSLLNQIYKNDLKITIIDKGVIGTIFPIPTNLVLGTKKLKLTTNQRKKNCIKYLGINLEDECLSFDLQHVHQLKNFDYSTIDKQNCILAGLAHYNETSQELEYDSELSWILSDQWKLDEAATFPYAYVSAYYCLMIKGKLQAGESVLIHCGCSAIGQAAISIASSIKCTIYTTVSSDKEKLFLLKTFDMLQDRNVFYHQKGNFECLLKVATFGNGVDVILNNLSGSIVQSSVECLAYSGRFIQIGKYDLKINAEIGLLTFLNSTSFSVISLNKLHKLPENIKIAIKTFIDLGLKNFFVRPICHNIITPEQIQEAVLNIGKPNFIGKTVVKVDESFLNRANLLKPSQFVCDSDKSYLIFGGQVEDWLDCVEWLVYRGAQSINVFSTFNPQKVGLLRRLSLLQQNYHTNVNVINNLKLGNIQALLQQIHDIDLALFLPINEEDSYATSEIDLIKNISTSLKKLDSSVTIVNFVSSCAGLFELRAKFNQTFNVQKNKKITFHEVLSNLDNVFYNCTNHTFINSKDISHAIQESPQALVKKLKLMVPASIKEFVNQMENAPLTADIVQVSSIGPRTSREVIPIIVIPGLTGHKEMYDMCLNFLYPTYCIVLPSQPISIYELAADCVQKIKKLFPSNVFNIVAISWGGALAVELSRILSAEGASLHLYFIDSSPLTLQSTIHQLGETSSAIETNILRRMLHLKDGEAVKKIESMSLWSDKLELAIKTAGVDADAYQLKRSLTLLKSYLEYLHDVPLVDELISGRVHLIRPSEANALDSCGLPLYCRMIPQIRIVNGDHITIINSNDTTEYINENHYII